MFRRFREEGLRTARSTDYNTKGSGKKRKTEDTRVLTLSESDQVVLDGESMIAHKLPHDSENTQLSGHRPGPDCGLTFDRDPLPSLRTFLIIDSKSRTGQYDCHHRGMSDGKTIHLPVTITDCNYSKNLPTSSTLGTEDPEDKKYCMDPSRPRHYPRLPWF